MFSSILVVPVVLLIEVPLCGGVLAWDVVRVCGYPLMHGLSELSPEGVMEAGVGAQVSSQGIQGGDGAGAGGRRGLLGGRGRGHHRVGLCTA